MRIRVSIFLLMILAACSSTPPQPGMKLGKPYFVNGGFYVPEYEPDYDETGAASWYGPGFNGKSTASGETFNQNAMTAAHRTLPMPSLVRVTNLQNGRSIIVRINDRGPFKSGRIIDLSKGAARKLGILSVAEVRVQYLKAATEKYIAAVQGGERNIDIAELARSAEQPPSQIVENIDSSTHAGQVVDEAAPVMTVSSDDLQTPASSPQPSVSNQPPKHSIQLIKDAMAEENVPQQAVYQPQASPVTDEYIVQAGSFSAEENARRLASRLEHVSPLTVDKADTPDHSWWRVRLGPFKDKASADDALARVRAAGVIDAKIIHL